MNRRSVFSFIAVFSFVAGIGYFSSISASVEETESHAESPKAASTSARYLIQAESLEIAKQAVEAIGGDVTHELGIINAVGATLSSEQLSHLNKDTRLHIEADRKAGVASSPIYPTLSGAADLHGLGITGHGVTVAVVEVSDDSANASS